MIYVSIDIETTGKDPETCDLLSVGAVIEDTKKMLPWEEVPKFYAIVPREHIKGHPVALEMNKELIGLIAYWLGAGPAERKQFPAKIAMGLLGLHPKQYTGGFVTEDVLTLNFQRWLIAHGVITEGLHFGDEGRFNVAGKNFGVFDKPFLDKVPGWKTGVGMLHRIIDPAMLFVEWGVDDKLPTMGECMVRAGVPGRVQHHALYDAWDVVQVLRTDYRYLTRD